MQSGRCVSPRPVQIGSALGPRVDAPPSRGVGAELWVSRARGGPSLWPSCHFRLLGDDHDCPGSFSLTCLGPIHSVANLPSQFFGFEVLAASVSWGGACRQRGAVRLAPAGPGPRGAHLLSGAVCKNRSQLQPRFGLLRPHDPASRQAQGSAAAQGREPVRVRHWGHTAPRGKLWFHPGGKPGFQESPPTPKAAVVVPPA